MAGNEEWGNPAALGLAGFRSNDYRPEPAQPRGHTDGQLHPGVWIHVRWPGPSDCRDYRFQEEQCLRQDRVHLLWALLAWPLAPNGLGGNRHIPEGLSRRVRYLDDLVERIHAIHGRGAYALKARAATVVLTLLTILFFMLAVTQYSETILRIAGAWGVLTGLSAVYTSAALIVNTTTSREILPE